jgi:hypothetical protein
MPKYPACKIITLSKDPIRDYRFIFKTIIVIQPITQSLIQSFEHSDDMIYSDEIYRFTHGLVFLVLVDPLLIGRIKENKRDQNKNDDDNKLVSFISSESFGTQQFRLSNQNKSKQKRDCQRAVSPLSLLPIS